MRNSYWVLLSTVATLHTARSEALSDKVDLSAVAHVTGDVQATFNFSWAGSNIGIFLKVSDLQNFTNTTLGGYTYHIHTNPIDDTADTLAARCGAALGHLDPLNVTDNIVCSPDFPSYCQLGDLSGMYGKINATTSGVVEPFNQTTRYLRFYPEEFSILGRSIVIHGYNKTRLACGNIISHLDGTMDPATGQATNKSSTYQTAYPSVAPPPPVTTVPIGNSGELSTAGLKLPAPLTPYAQAPEVILTTANGIPTIETADFAVSGTALPKHGDNEPHNSSTPSSPDPDGSSLGFTATQYLLQLLLGVAISFAGMAFL